MRSKDLFPPVIIISADASHPDHNRPGTFPEGRIGAVGLPFGSKATQGGISAGTVVDRAVGSTSRRWPRLQKAASR